jgi:hypothetical protein
MRICDHWSVDPPGPHFEPLKLRKFAFNAEPSDPAFHYYVDPDPDLAFQNNADPDPQPCFLLLVQYGTVGDCHYPPHRWVDVGRYGCKTA